MLSEVALSRTQFRAIHDLKDGSLLIAYLDKKVLCMQTTGSDIIYQWNGHNWVALGQAPKRARFAP